MAIAHFKCNHTRSCLSHKSCFGIESHFTDSMSQTHNGLHLAMKWQAHVDPPLLWPPSNFRDRLRP